MKYQGPIFLKMCEEIIHDWYHIDYLATHVLSEFNLKIIEPIFFSSLYAGIPIITFK